LWVAEKNMRAQGLIAQLHEAVWTQATHVNHRIGSIPLRVVAKSRSDDVVVGDQCAVGLKKEAGAVPVGSSNHGNGWRRFGVEIQPPRPVSADTRFPGRIAGSIR
jgi:hypothetical protein